MFCQFCGTKLDENSSFCSKCGAKIVPAGNTNFNNPIQQGTTPHNSFAQPSSEPQAQVKTVQLNDQPFSNSEAVLPNSQPQPQENPVHPNNIQQPNHQPQPNCQPQPNYQPQPNNYNYNNSYPAQAVPSADFMSLLRAFLGLKKPSVRNNFTDIVRGIAASPLFILASIIFTIGIIVNISSAERTAYELKSALDSIAVPLRINDSSSFILDIIDFLTDSTSFLKFLILLPSIAIAAGLWITVIGAFVKVYDTMSTAGLGIIRAVNTAMCVLSVIGAIGLGVFYGGLSYKVSKYHGEIPEVITMSFVIMIIALIIAAFIKKAFNRVIDSIRYSIDRKCPLNISPVGYILCIAIAVINFALVAAGTLRSVVWFDIICLLCFAIVLYVFGYSMKIQQKISLSQNSEQEQHISQPSNSAHPGVNAVQPPQASYYAPQPYPAGNYGYPAYQPEARTMSSASTKKTAIAAISVVSVVILTILLLVIFNTCSASNIDDRIVGKWRYNSNSKAIMEFTSSGDYRANAGTDHEEFGTFYTEDGVIYVTILGNESPKNYRVIDDNRIQIEREYYNSRWETETEWVDLYRVT